MTGPHFACPAVADLNSQTTLSTGCPSVGTTLLLFDAADRNGKTLTGLLDNEAPVPRFSSSTVHP